MTKFFMAAAYLVAASLLLLSSFCRADEPAAEWQQLFNGKDLTGWTPKVKGFELGDNHADTFRVEDGILKVGYDKYNGPFRGRFGHLFYEKPFANYVLRVEYRFVGEQA